MNRSSFWASLTGTAALIAIVASSRDAEGAAVPGTPTPTLQTSTYNSVTVSWPPVAEAQQYTVQLCTIAMCRGDSPKWFKVDPATNTSGGRVVYTVKDLSASARYYVYVQSVVLSPEAAKSPWSVGVDVTTPAAPQVTVRAVLESDDRITCFYYTVPARANSASLNRYADATAEKPFSGYGMDERATRQCYLLDWKEGDACPSTYYSVSTTVGSGAYRKRYESERVKPDCPCPSAPAAPTNLTLTPTNGVDCRGGIDLSWTAPPVAEGCVQSSVQIGGFQGMYPVALATVDVGTGATATTHLPVYNVAATNMFPGNTYKFTIAAKNERGVGAASAPVSITCK